MFKKSVIAASSFFSIFVSGLSHAEVCYTVEGKVDTINVSPTEQVGTIELVLLDADDNVAFGDSGENPAFLRGAFDGGTPFSPTLAHTAIFLDGSSMQTAGDTVRIDFANPRKFDSQGQPCSFDVTENITKSQGTGFFQDVTSIDITATGYISACVEDGPLPDENENEFELSGKLCKSQ
jgi:hypothetical protein